MNNLNVEALKLFKVILKCELYVLWAANLGDDLPDTLFTDHFTAWIFQMATRSKGDAQYSWLNGWQCISVWQRVARSEGV